MIRIFTTGLEGDRTLSLDEVQIHTQKIDPYGAPYILFEHTDYPLGALMATYDGTFWQCDLN